MLANGFLLTGLVLALLAQKGCAIRCFSCDSTSEFRCGDNFRLTNVAAEECQGTCYKKRGDRWEGDVRNVDVQRGCLEQTTEKCYNENLGGISFKVCTCNTDFCNRGDRARSVLALVTCVLTLLYNY